MSPFFRSYRAAERAALAPLLEIACTLDPGSIPAFLDDLRVDAPTVAARLAELLSQTPHPSPERHSATWGGLPNRSAAATLGEPSAPRSTVPSLAA